jgi:hypothetical protein
MEALDLTVCKREIKAYSWYCVFTVLVSFQTVYQRCLSHLTLTHKTYLYQLVYINIALALLKHLHEGMIEAGLGMVQGNLANMAQSDFMRAKLAESMSALMNVGCASDCIISEIADRTIHFINQL